MEVSGKKICRYHATGSNSKPDGLPMTLKDFSSDADLPSRPGQMETYYYFLFDLIVCDVNVNHSNPIQFHIN